ncbi:MAG TPA: molybdopterin-dependent oxidoreductase [Chloroflexota bacterium]|jgi:DMSO/TMAO reductase YedYZ molybdopterin-dependent catalytic subunit
MRARITAVALLVGLLFSYGSLALAQTREFSPTVAVEGQVDTPRTYTLADVQALPAESMDPAALDGSQMAGHAYRGVRLYDLLQTAGPRFDRARNNDSLRFYAVVTGTDGYQAVIAWGELDPGFEGKAVLLAYEQDGQPLGPPDGMARLVVPGDQRGGRYVSNVRTIALQRAPDA